MVANHYSPGLNLKVLLGGESLAAESNHILLKSFADVHL